MQLPAGIVYRNLQTRDFLALQRLLPTLLPGDWSLPALQRLLISTHLCRVLVRADPAGSDTLLGFVEFSTVLDECELLNLAVDRAAQGRGLGRMLLQAMLEEARDAGCGRCLLEVRRSNDAAIALYVSEGFELDGIRKAYYPPQPGSAGAEDALLYSLTLPAAAPLG